MQPDADTNPPGAVPGRSLDAVGRRDDHVRGQEGAAAKVRAGCGILQTDNEWELVLTNVNPLQRILDCEEKGKLCKAKFTIRINVDDVQ